MAALLSPAGCTNYRDVGLTDSTGPNAVNLRDLQPGTRVRVLGPRGDTFRASFVAVHGDTLVVRDKIYFPHRFPASRERRLRTKYALKDIRRLALELNDSPR